MNLKEKAKFIIEVYDREVRPLIRDGHYYSATTYLDNWVKSISHNIREFVRDVDYGKQIYDSMRFLSKELKNGSLCEIWDSTKTFEEYIYYFSLSLNEENNI